MLLAPVSTEIAFWHGMDRLVGDVVLPPWPGPHPAVLLVRPPTAGPGQCTWQQRLAAAGIASLAFDPPGGGRSTGDWRRQSVSDRASEVLAAREVLVAHPDVAGHAIALLVVGESGWAGIRAEASARVFAGLVLLSVPVLEPVAVEQYRLGRRLERHGYGPDDVGVAVAVLRERFRRLSAGAAADDVLRAEAACRAAGWYGLMPQLTEADVPLFTRLVGVDPAPELTAVTCPVLALNGGSDLSVPVQRNVEAVLAALRSAGHADHACVVVPDADHELRGPGPEVAPGVHELVVTWLDRRLARARRAAGAEGAARPARQSGRQPMQQSVQPSVQPSVQQPVRQSVQPARVAQAAQPPAPGYPPVQPTSAPAPATARPAAVPAPSALLPVAAPQSFASQSFAPQPFVPPVLPQPATSAAFTGAPAGSPGGARAVADADAGGRSWTVDRAGYVPPADDLFAPRPNGTGDPYVGGSGWELPAPVAPAHAAHEQHPQHRPAARRPVADGELHLPTTEVMPVVGRPPRRPAF